MQDATPTMKTLLASHDRIEILERLANVRLDAQARWGTMSSHQMICHSSDSLRAALGQKYISPSTSLLKRAVLKPLALWVPISWPHGVKTRPEMDQQQGGTRPLDFSSDLEELRILVKRFCAEEGEFAPHDVEISIRSVFDICPNMALPL